MENNVSPAERDAVLARYSDARLNLTVKMPFFGHLLLKMEPVVTRKVPLAAVNQARQILMNPDWAQATSQSEFMSTVVHEMLHCAFLTFSRQNGRDVMVTDGSGRPMSLWNIAADYTINEVIGEMAPEDGNRARDSAYFLHPKLWEPAGLWDEKYLGWSSEEVYDDLLNKVKGDPKNGSMSLQGVKFDADQSDMQPGGGEGDGEGDGEASGGTPSQKESEQYWKVALSEAVQVAEQSSKNMGKLPASLRKMIQNILDPRVPWTDVLSRWVGENGKRCDFSYLRPSRRSQAIGEILPSMRKNGVADVVVLWDTSGSMHGKEQEILSEVIAICQDLDLALRLITCDSNVHTDVMVSGVEDLQEIGGGGGSDFCPAFKLVEDDGFEGVVIAFTDGYIVVPETQPNHIQGVLWVIWDGDVDPTNGRWGNVLNVDKDGYQKKEGK